MSKGNSELLSKHQSRQVYTSTGIIGNEKGYEVLTEVVIRLKNESVRPTHEVRICGRMATDDDWYPIGSVVGPFTDIFHIASWDYIMFECIIYDAQVEGIMHSSAYFQDGMFAVNAITKMNEEISLRLDSINDSICKVNENIQVLKSQMALITDHEEDEVT